MIRLLLISALLFLAGCGRAEDRADAIKTVIDGCDGTASVAIQIGTFGDSITARCDWIKKAKNDH